MEIQRPQHEGDANVGKFIWWTIAVVWGLWFVVCVLGGSHIELLPQSLMLCHVRQVETVITAWR
jgi:hypothetical protein